jgi:formate hydrogenlyase subunit 3/multisubunit Na+/H+ antiporter MnhD subunit
MLDLLLGLGPVAPAVVGLLLLGWPLVGPSWEERHERVVARVAGMALLVTLTADAAWLALSLRGGLAERTFGLWLEHPRVAWSLSANLPLAAIALTMALASAAALRFAVTYMHRESRFAKFVGGLLLFSGAMQLIALGGNPALTFLGWEVAGACSALLIAYRTERPAAVAGGVRALLTNRVGDAAFLLALGLWASARGGLDWADASTVAAASPAVPVLLVIAAAAKSAQVPFTPWIARAMEGPTPSSTLFYGAAMVHAGLVLLIRAGDALALSAPAAALAVGIGLLSAVVGGLAALAQPDVKGGLVQAAVAQIGLGFIGVGLGLPGWAALHLCAHALVRGMQFILSPAHLSELPAGRTPAIGGWLASQARLQRAARERFYLEAAHENLVAAPLRALAERLAAFDTAVVERLSGQPADEVPEVGGPAAAADRPRGFAVASTARVAAAVEVMEELLVGRFIGDGLPRGTGRLGAALDGVERRLAQPWTIAVAVAIGLGLAFGSAP